MSNSDSEKSEETPRTDQKVTETNPVYSLTNGQNQGNAENSDGIFETTHTPIVKQENIHIGGSDRQRLEYDNCSDGSPTALPMDGFLEHDEEQEEAQEPGVRMPQPSDNRGTVDGDLTSLPDSDDQSLEEDAPEQELSEPGTPGPRFQSGNVTTSHGGNEPQEDVFRGAELQYEVRPRPVAIPVVSEPVAHLGPAPNYSFAAPRQSLGWTWPRMTCFAIRWGFVAYVVLMSLMHTCNKVWSAHEGYGIGPNTFNVTAIEWMTVTVNPSATSIAMPTGTVSSILFTTLSVSATPTPTAA